MVRSALILFAACLALACRASRPESAGTAPRAAAQWHPLDAAARRNARLRGVWKAEGYGHLVVIADDVRVFHHADNFCVADSGLVPGFALYSLAAGGERLSLLHEDYGAASEELQTRVDLRRLEALPARCAARAEAATPGVVFDALATLLQEHYGFFTERRVEWAPLRDRYRPLASRASDTDSLFPVLRTMLGHINDGHLNLSRRGGPAFNARAARAPRAPHGVVAARGDAWSIGGLRVLVASARGRLRASATRRRLAPRGRRWCAGVGDDWRLGGVHARQPAQRVHQRRRPAPRAAGFAPRRARPDARRRRRREGRDRRRRDERRRNGRGGHSGRPSVRRP